MKALHNLDGWDVDESLRPDLQRIHEDEPDAKPSVPELTDLNACIQYIFGGRGW